MKNKTKDYIVITIICVLVIWFLSGAVWYVQKLFAEELTDVEIQNKLYAEWLIQREMEYFKMWEYTEQMAEIEYIDTFYKGE